VSFSSLLALASYSSFFNVLAASVSRVLELFLVCNKKGGFCAADFVIEFFGEVYIYLYINPRMKCNSALNMSTCNRFRFTLLGGGMKNKMVLSIYKITAKIKLLSFTTSCWKNQRYCFINLNFVNKIFGLT
jgi:hypothetical protein